MLGKERSVRWDTPEGLRESPARIGEEKGDYAHELDRCEDFRDIFALVKRSVKHVLGMRRVGLILYLSDLPMRVGAYHGVGTNAIVMNRTLLELVEKASGSRREVNSFVFSILLHEYLHSLGVLNEQRVKKLTWRVTREVFGEGHIATGMAIRGPWAFLGRLPQWGREPYSRETEIIKDFEDPDQKYIS
jgi:hypothetical protein